SAITMGMGVLLSWTAVRRPTCVSDAVIARQRRRSDHGFEIRELPGAAPKVDATVAHHGDAGRVVSSILEPPQSVNQDGHDVLRPDISNNPAHSYFFFRFFAQSSILRCLPALTARASAGTSSRIVVPLPT